MFLRNPAAIAGMAMLLIVLVVAVAGPWLYPADPFEIRTAPLTPPFSEDAWLGSDYLGRDVLTALIYGGRATLLVGAVAALLSVLIGITLGAFAGYYGGKVDAALMKLTEFFQVLPALLFAMVVVTLFSPTLVTVTLAIGIVSWTGTARLTRIMRANLLDELNKPDSWRALLPSSTNLRVALRKLPPQEADLVLHPVGVLRVSQRG